MVKCVREGWSEDFEPNSNPSPRRNKWVRIGAVRLGQTKSWAPPQTAAKTRRQSNWKKKQAHNRNNCSWIFSISRSLAEGKVHEGGTKGK